MTLAVLASGFLIYSGWNAGEDNMGQTFNKTADQLDEQIRTANTAISSGDWDQEKETYTANTEQSFEQRAVAEQVNISAADYGMSRLLSPPVNRNTKKREDPEIYAASDLRAHALTGPVAYMLPDGAVDPTAADEPAIREEPEEKKTPTGKKSSKKSTTAPATKATKKDKPKAKSGGGMFGAKKVKKKYEGEDGGKVDWFLKEALDTVYDPHGTGKTIKAATILARSSDGNVRVRDVVRIYAADGEDGISDLAWTSPLTKYIIEAFDQC